VAATSEVARPVAKKQILRIGPLVSGEELARGFRIARLALDADSIRVELSAENSRRVAIGVSSKQKRLERPPPLEFPDLAVWYVGRGEVPSEYPDLARALVDRLERARGSMPAAEALERWRAEALDGG
jgi:hypothetical protein